MRLGESAPHTRDVLAWPTSKLTSFLCTQYSPTWITGRPQSFWRYRCAELIIPKIVSSSNKMGRTAPVGRELLPCSNNLDDDHASRKSPKSVVGLASVLLQPFRLMTFPWIFFFIVSIFAMNSLNIVSAQSNFSVLSTSYNCSSNIICLGGAHSYNGSSDTIQVGRLSLVPEPSYTNSLGIAYYNVPVRLLDLSTRQAASFKTSFTVDTVWGIYPNASDFIRGEGFAVVISADNSGTGAVGGYLGFFDIDGNSTVKSIIVEFDTTQDQGPPQYDISDNHISLDLETIQWVAAKNASDVSVDLQDQTTLYAWVDYSSDTEQLEVRISNSDRRPTDALLNYTVDLFDVVEEYMWVGFTSSTGYGYDNIYIGDWSFECYGILAPELAPSPSPSVSSPSPTAGLIPDHLARAKASGIKLGVIVGISVGIPTLLLTGLVVALYIWKRPGGRQQLGLLVQEDPMIQFGDMFQQFSYKQLSVATGAFKESSKLGAGGFGSVYRGVLPSSGIPVAVKKISSDSTQGEKEFMAEVAIISQLRHRNLIQILGWCKDTGKEKYLLVYELMPNGSLDKVLFGCAAETQSRACLSWEQRLNIVAGIAAALDYLHQGWNQQIIHRDVKSSNILLDEEMNAKLGDFGLARLVDRKRNAATTLMAGTYGYIAPEVLATGKFTEKTDVFGFGAVVLEVACGREALSGDVPEDEMNLANWVWNQLSVGDLMSTVDKRLGDYDARWMEVMLMVGLMCSHPNPLARPSMRHVVLVLTGDVPVSSITASMPAFVNSAESMHHYLENSGSERTFNFQSGSTSPDSTRTSSGKRGPSTVNAFEISSDSNR